MYYIHTINEHFYFFDFKTLYKRLKIANQFSQLQFLVVKPAN